MIDTWYFPAIIDHLEDFEFTNNPKFQDQKGARKNCDLFFSPREVLSVPTACPLIYDNEWQASGRRPPYQPPALTANPKTNKQTHIALASTRKHYEKPGVSGKGFLAPGNGKGNWKSHSRFTGRERELENATGREGNGKFEACNPGNSRESYKSQG